MIFHTPDPTFARLAQCWKRAESFARAGNIDPAHPLAVAWANCEFMLTNADTFESRLLDGYSLKARSDSSDRLFDLCCLDWFAAKVEEFSKTNLLQGDESLAAILVRWRKRVFIDPVILRSKERIYEQAKTQTRSQVDRQKSHHGNAE